MHHIVQIYYRVMALYLSLNFVFAQYLKNDLMEQNFAYTLILTRSKLGFYVSIGNLHKFITELWPLIHVRISFHLK